MRREVWSFHEATIEIYEEDASGNVLDLVRELCFTQNASVRTIRRVIEHEEPGVGFVQKHAPVIGYDVRLAEFWERKSNQVTPFVEYGKRYRILIQNVNPLYDDLIQVNDPLDMRGCTVSEGPNLAWQDDDITAWDIGFHAEEMVSG